MTVNPSLSSVRYLLIPYKISSFKWNLFTASTNWLLIKHTLTMHITQDHFLWSGCLSYSRQHHCCVATNSATWSALLKFCSVSHKQHFVLNPLLKAFCHKNYELITILSIQVLYFYSYFFDMSASSLHIGIRDDRTFVCYHTIIFKFPCKLIHRW